MSNQVTSILDARGLNKAYPLPGQGRIEVLSACSVSINPGETLAITGQSGSGKSTLLALLAGLDQPDSGQVAIEGVEISEMNEDRLTRFRAQKIGMVFQQFHLMPHLSAAENVRLPLEILGQQDRDPRTRTMLQLVGLSQRAHHLPRQLSGGECQRVAIARALVIEPALLLADEPTGNLDIDTGEAISALLFDLVARQNMTMIVVTHNLGLANRCQRICKLEQGQLSCGPG